MSNAKLKFNCTRGERTFGHPHLSFSTSRTYPPPPPSPSPFFRIPSLSGRGFCARENERAVRSTRNTTVVRDNDNQRVKWGLISFGRGRVERERRDREWRRCGEVTGAGRKMRVYTCQETRRLVHNIGGPCADPSRSEREARGGERTETRGRLSASRA